MKINKLILNELPQIIKLFLLVWKQNPKIVLAKTNWAFDNEANSKVLVMKNDKDDIISVRGGIKWPLVIKNKNIKTYQLHGTCVHPDYRRMGIFSKINKEFVKQVSEEGYQLIFNVSVEASKLGYEKIGWKYINGFRRLTKFNNPINIAKEKFLKPKISIRSEFIEDLEKINIPDEFLKVREEHFKNLLHTSYDKNFLKWRLSNLQEKYQSYSTDKCIVIYKIKYVGNLKELIIGEIFMLEYSFTDFKKSIEGLTNLERQDLTYSYIFNTHPYYSYYLRFFFTPNPFKYNLHFGTRILGENNKDLLNNKKWGLSFLDIDTF